METRIISNQTSDCEKNDMNNDRIKQTEIDLLSTAIHRIISSEVLENSMSDQLPLTVSLSDSNKVYQGKASILFVDIRESTKLPEKYNTTQLVKIYRSYIRTVVQAIRYSGGVVRDFMGDGVLAVFIDNEEGKSEDKSVRAARYITTAIDKFLNPALEQAVKYRISCGIGIHTGSISLSKVGMKGREQQDDAENEFGIAWIGNSTNLACKFSSAVANGTIFISSSTYSELSDINGKQQWKKAAITKGSNVLSGYMATQYYLQLDTEVPPYPADKSDTLLSPIEELKLEYQKQIADIAKRAETLGKKEQSLQAKESTLNSQSEEITRRNEDLFSREQALNNRIYRFHFDVLRSAHCKADYTKEMGQDFWEDNLSKLLFAGSQIGKDEHTVKQDISFAMVSIYEDLEQYDKAYEFLVEQAAGHSWLHLSTVQNIVKRVRYCDRLKSAIYLRLAQNDLSPENKSEFEQIKNWLVFEYKR